MVWKSLTSVGTYSDRVFSTASPRDIITVFDASGGRAREGGRGMSSHNSKSFEGPVLNSIGPIFVLLL